MNSLRRTLVVLALVAMGATGRAQQPAAGATANLDQTVANLGSFDFPTRTSAARAIRRMPAATVSPVLVRAARSHADEYVRFRALVLLSGLDEKATAPLMREVLADRNDRLRTLAFQWFERHPDPDVLPAMVTAFQKELSEFVRPALTRAIAAQGKDPRAREVMLPLVTRGEDFFRGAVLEALGDYDGTYALPRIIEVAKLEGPLQDDAITALGKIGDRSARPVLVELQQAGEPEVQPTVSAALCLLQIDCEARVKFLQTTLTFAAGREGYQPLLRGVVHALSSLAVRGRADAFVPLLDAGIASTDPARAAIALGVGLVALRNPPLLLDVLEKRSDREGAMTLLVEAFDMLSEDFEEERFYVQMRQIYWAAPEGSARRGLAEQLIERLEF